jgi:hypothetical protein
MKLKSLISLCPICWGRKMKRLAVAERKDELGREQGTGD